MSDLKEFRRFERAGLKPCGQDGSAGSAALDVMRRGGHTYDYVVVVFVHVPR